jgi:hypothetical protein
MFALLLLAAILTTNGTVAAEPHTIEAGRLHLVLLPDENGISQAPVSLGPDECLEPAPPTVPLFSLTISTLPEEGAPETLTLDATTGWKETSITAGPDPKSTGLSWSEPNDDRLQGLTVRVQIQSRPEESALAWSIAVQNDNPNLTLREVVFPNVAVQRPDPHRFIFFPRGPGTAKSAVASAFHDQGPYPNGWTTMQFMAVYGAGADDGFYLGMHDPWGSLKHLHAQSLPDTQSAAFSIRHPVPDMSRGGNDFQLPGQAVWRTFQGDWFDASLIYRTWVEAEAKWWPAKENANRQDTPEWMRTLPVWLRSSGKAETVVPQALDFAREMGLPTGLHWYNWHQIAFDDDYPHYFPAHDDFEAGVAELQRNGVFVMPYINGRLWDTRDHGLEDKAFSTVALPATARQESGEPYIETYNSKEPDGSPVRLAPMCPTTPVWQSKVAEIVHELTRQCGVKGVYIDQIAAAKPMPCFDPSHGHPLGGGHWWNEGYWHMLDNIHAAIPHDAMLTSECNAEPFLRWFDGYLSWHWQFQDQVPAFSAIYGGTIQLFGRAYRGGTTRDLALRMKAGQQLVFGEQIGWITPDILESTNGMPFLKRMANLRWKLSPYFHQGRMERPPILQGEVPNVTADWQWSGEWPVTIAAIQTGAWRIPHENRLALVFVNVDKKPHAATFDLDLIDYGLSGEHFAVEMVGPDTPDATWQTGRRLKQTVEFQPDRPFALEIRPIPAPGKSAPSE